MLNVVIQHPACKQLDSAILTLRGAALRNDVEAALLRRPGDIVRKPCPPGVLLSFVHWIKIGSELYFAEKVI